MVRGLRDVKVDGLEHKVPRRVPLARPSELQAIGEGVRGCDLSDLIAALRAQGRTLIAVADALERGEVGTVASLCTAGNQAVFRREGEYWTVSYGGKTVHLKDRVGLRYIHTLLRAPSEDIPVLSLMGGALELCARGAEPRRSTTARASRAWQEMRATLQDLEDACEEAERNNDFARVAAIRQRRGVLLRSVMERRNELLPTVERARVAVSKAIQRVLATMRCIHPELAAYFKQTIHLGYACRYEPSGQQPPRWSL